ncbi:MAG TPA: GTPase HflX [Paenalcaligenes sp.]|nr:GTPase HflX [Paenalcaligenes sp.]
MRALVVSVDLNDLDYAAHAEEFLMLARGAGAQVCDIIQVRRRRPDPAHYVGKGKLDEIISSVHTHNVDIILFDQPLSPAQQRNIEQAANKRVVDRVALILDIFALRAQSHEGKLQVELAQLQHLSTRLTGRWSHLERQQGGIGTRGPGESQLELDRRMIGRRVKTLRQRLEKLGRQRTTQRRARMRGDVFNVSLVGYTNAGKSTLFNALTRAEAYAADQLFATLDTTSRRIWIHGVGHVVLSDTVGFIRDLPPTLIAAFKATLEETVHADLLLHVVDAASPQRDEQIFEVNKVLDDIGAGEVPRILVYNKIDQTHFSPRIERDDHGIISRVFVSSIERTGLDDLRDAIVEASKVSENNAIHIKNI